MAQLKLKDRVESYKDSSDYKLLNKVPIIICINGRNFSKVTSLLEKPYCEKFSECMLSTTLKLCSEVEGTLFAYQFNDEIVIVARNDQSLETSPWFDNKIQKISSVTSAMASLHFNSCINSMGLKLMADPIFISHVFPVPNVMEAINTIIYKQQGNFHSSIYQACFYELLNKYDKNEIKDMLVGLGVDDKIGLLQQERDINFNDYPLSFRRGAGCYKTPQIVNGVMKSKWTINLDLPTFTVNTSFLNNIFKMGSDIFRQENI